MTEPTNEQLQERCLEFAGFEYKVVNWHLPNAFYTMAWVAPNGQRFISDPLEQHHPRTPDFLNSVDAHVKWTLPKLYWWDLFGFKGGGYVVLVQYKKSSPIINHHTETPALAICKAIWELKEGNNDNIL